MKKVFVLLLISLFGVVSFGQNSKSPSYEIKGNLIAATLYHDNGVVAQTGFYTEDGKLQGEWTSYNLNGEKTATAFYNKGEKVGTWTFYQGDEMKKVDYTDSRISKVQTWKVTDTRVVTY
ncbi:MAG: nicotinic acid mononucleotide adenyltransferase [Flavobacteriaceae bacterium]